MIVEIEVVDSDSSRTVFKRVVFLLEPNIHGLMCHVLSLPFLSSEDCFGIQNLKTDRKLNLRMSGQASNLDRSCVVTLGWSCGRGEDAY